MDARKVRFDEKAAWKIVKDAKTITIAKGRAMDATGRGKTGLEALKHILLTPAGTCQLTPMCRPTEAYLDMSFERIIRDL